MRQAITLLLALGVLLGAAAPSLAMSMALKRDLAPTGMLMMTGMAMSSDCMEAMERGAPNKSLPRKNVSAACGVCTGCALPVLPQTSFSELLYGSSQNVFTHDAIQSGIAILPALPPPIA